MKPQGKLERSRFELPFSGTSVPGTQLIFKTLRSASGSEVMAVDASTLTGAGPQRYFYAVKRDLYISRINFMLLGPTAGSGATFLNLAALAKGVRVELQDRNNQVVLDYLDGLPIKKSLDWARIAGIDVGLEQKHLIIRWSLWKTGAGHRLRDGDQVVVTIQDNLASLSAFEAALQGYQP